MNKILYTLSSISSIVAMGAITYGTFLAIYPFKVSDVGQPYKILNPYKQVQRGDNLVMEIVYTKYLNVRAASEQSIICNQGELTVLPSSASNLPVGTNRLIIYLNVPTKTPIGDCIYRQEIEYNVNRFQTQKKTYLSEPFTVLP